MLSKRQAETAERIESLTRRHQTETALLKDKELEKQRIESKIENLKVLDFSKAGTILQKISEKHRESAKKALEQLGTQALQYSLGPDYEMRIFIPDKKTRPEAYIRVFNKKTRITSDPVEQNGGGVVDIISIALMIIMLQTSEPKIEGPLILDEPFKMVSKDYIPMLSKFMQRISDEFDRQMIIITHNEYLAAVMDRQIEVTLEANAIGDMRSHIDQTGDVIQLK